MSEFNSALNKKVLWDIFFSNPNFTNDHITELQQVSTNFEKEIGVIDQTYENDTTMSKNKLFINLIKKKYLQYKALQIQKPNEINFSESEYSMYDVADKYSELQAIRDLEKIVKELTNRVIKLETEQKH
jgi:hypothetical protein